MAHTDTFADMLKYMSVIRLGAKRSTVGWKLYDEQFRLRRAKNPACSWATIDAELWLLYMHGSLTPLASPVNKVQKCYGFNYNGACSKPTCHYSHSCMRCFGPHPLKFCLKPNNQYGNSGNEFNRQARPQFYAHTPNRGRGGRFSQMQNRPRF